MVRHYFFRFLNVRKAIRLLTELKECLLKHPDKIFEDITLSANHCTIVSKCLNFVVTYGFTTCLIPSIWKSFENDQKHIQFTQKISPDKVMIIIYYFNYHNSLCILYI